MNRPWTRRDFGRLGLAASASALASRKALGAAKAKVVVIGGAWIAGGGVHCHTNDEPAASTIGTAPIADFTVAAAIGAAPFEAHFTDLSSESPTNWTWTFGDGGTSEDQNPVYTYDTDGTYTVSLSARSAAGTDTTVRTDYITVPEPGGPLSLGIGLLFIGALNARRRARHSGTSRG